MGLRLSLTLGEGPHVAHASRSDHRMDMAEQGEQEGSEKEPEAGRPAWRGR